MLSKKLSLSIKSQEKKGIRKKINLIKGRLIIPPFLFVEVKWKNFGPPGGLNISIRSKIKLKMTNVFFAV